MQSAISNRVPNIAAEYILPTISLHAFLYWHTTNSFTGNCVSTDVINFFNTYK
jgi:hypothetical protein